MSAASSTRFHKWLAGCAISLVALVALIVMLAFAGYWWISTPGPQVDTEWFIGPETAGVFHLDRPFEDDGVLEFANALVQGMQEKQRELIRSRSGVVDPLARILQPGRRDVRRDLQADAPRQVTVTLELVEGSNRPQPAAVLNLSRYSRLFRLGTRFYGWLADDAERFRGLTLVPVEKGALTFVEDTLVWSSDRAALRQILERLDDLPSNPETRAVHPPGEGLADPRWDLFGRVENRGGAIETLLELWKEDLESRMPSLPDLLRQILQAVRSADVGLDLQPGDGALVWFRIEALDPTDLQTWNRLLGERLAELSRQPSALKSFRLEEERTSLQGELELHGLQEALKGLFLQLIPAEELAEEPAS